MLNSRPSRMKRYHVVFFLIFLTSSLTGCFSYKDLNYNGVENFKLGKIEEGQVSINFDLKLDNPNNYNIKIKPTDLTIFLGEKEFAVASLDQKLVIQKRTSSSYPVKIRARLKNLVIGGFSGIMDLAMNKSAEIRIKGPVKGSVYGFTKKVMIDEVRTVDLSSFKLPFFNQ
jgi:LEA14-like dessication related protein